MESDLCISAKNKSQKAKEIIPLGLLKIVLRLSLVEDLCSAG